MGTLAAHMNGVEQMVKLRGGIESMPADSMLKSALQLYVILSLPGHRSNNLSLHSDTIKQR